MKRKSDRRVDGIDLARGFAVLGMLGAHAIGGLQTPAAWIVNGHPTILFFLLAGVSVGLTVSRRPTDGPDAILRRQARLAVRAGLVFCTAVVVSFFPFNGILFVHAALLVTAALLSRAPDRVLLTLMVTLGIIGPTFFVLTSGGTFGGALDTMSSATLSGAVIADLTSALAVAAATFGGMLLGRAVLDGRFRSARVLLLGVLITATGLLLRGAGLVAAAIGSPAAPFLDGSAHANTTVEVVLSGGIGLSVIALCLRAGPAVLRVLRPVVDIGRMALTMYLLHFVLLNSLNGFVTRESDQWVLFAVAAAALLVTATLWGRFVGRGPVEWAIARLVETAVPRSTGGSRRGTFVLRRG